ncbi:antirestriction protein ArdA [Enterococcus faecalis]|uniref:antirestriction protein ArdA n=1 Tax=Enterococcus faecalis TaxID=1351 RepID=UPI0018991BC6|nr:antirestriction protein ArdA [Enterococcus faecalis]
MIELYIENPALKRGRWFELPIHLEEIQERLALEEEQEYLVTDYNAPYKISRYEDFEFMNELAENLEEYSGHHAINYLDELVEYGFYEDLLEAFEHIEDIQVYKDCYSYKDYAEYYVEECGYLSGIPDIIAWHIDYDGIGRDLSMEGNLYQADDSTIIEVGY